MHTLRKAAFIGAIAGLVFGALPAVAAEGGPSVTISSTAPSPNTGDNPIVFTITTSVPVSDNIEPGDIAVSGGYVSSVSGSGTSWTVNVVPGDTDPNHPKVAGTVTVKINENQFHNNTNLASNEEWRYFEPGAATSSAPRTTPTLTIDSGPAEGEVIATTSVTFGFTASEGATTMCTFGSTFACGSPMTLGPLGDSAYTLTIVATNAEGNASTSVTRSFSVMAATSSATSTAPDTGTPPTTGSTGGGGTPQNTSPSTPVREGGVGSQPSGTPTGNTVIPTVPSGNTVIPNGGAAVIPTVPAPTTQVSTNTDTSVGSSGSVSSASAAPVVSRSSGGLALTPTTGSGASAEDTSQTTQSTTTPVEDTGSELTIPTSSLGAAAATTDANIPGWVWLVLGGLVLIGIGVWALRQPVV